MVKEYYKTLVIQEGFKPVYQEDTAVAEAVSYCVFPIGTIVTPMRPKNGKGGRYYEPVKDPEFMLSMQPEELVKLEDTEIIELLYA